MPRKFSFSVQFCFCISVAILFTLVTAIDLDHDPLSGIDFLLTRLVTICLTIWLMHQSGFLTITEFRWSGSVSSLLWGIPLLLLGIGSIILSNAEGVIDLGEPPSVRLVAGFLLNMLFVGITEELLYRGLIFNTLLGSIKKGEEGKSVGRTIFLAAVVFGGVHFVNIFHLPLVNVLVQVLNAFSAGVLFCTIYWRYRSMLGIIIVHTLVDWSALFLQQLFPEVGSSVISAAMTPGQIGVTLLFGMGVPLSVGLILLHSKKV